MRSPAWVSRRKGGFPVTHEALIRGMPNVMPISQNVRHVLALLVCVCVGLGTNKLL